MIFEIFSEKYWRNNWHFKKQLLMVYAKKDHNNGFQEKHLFFDENW
jgi:hypothetical protein